MLAKRAQTVVLIALAILSTCARANPDGPTVVHGSASFSQPNANTLNVITGTNKSIINWKGFNIGAGQTTNFIQPNRNSAVLNRVLSNSASKIYGNLNSNGKVFLINQHGLMIGAGAKINTAGFYGSTLNITNDDFLKGNLKFEGGGFGGIINKGYIHAGPGGNVVLIAPDIENGGVIKVDNGRVVLAAGESIRITSLNDSSIEFDVKSHDDNSLINLGDIIAGQGAVRLFAGNLKHSGSISANGLVQNADGSISLVARDKVEISGTVVASAGKVEILADDIKIRSSAYIDVSGLRGGGEILIGGDQQGLNPAVRNATSTTIEAGAEVHADGIENADGGRVIVFAKQDVHVHGEVTAKGGAQSGDGGFIETSGLQVLDITSVPDASAPNGAAGEWLIDPNDITIQDTVNANITGTSDFVSTNDSAILTTTTIEAALNSGTSVTVTTASAGANTQSGNIIVLDPITKTAGADASIKLSADNNIVINADITSTVGRMDIILDADLGFGGGQIELAATTLDANGGTIDASGETVFINTTGPSPVVNSDMSILDLNLIEGALDGTGNITVNGLTTWNPLDASSLDESFTLGGSGILLASGGFDLGFF